MFPSKEEIQNSREIENNYKLYRGRYGDVLRHFRTYNDRKNKLEVVENVAGLISRVFADLMFLENAKVTINDEKAQEFYDELFVSSALGEQLWECALAQSYAGQTGFDLIKKDGKVSVSQLNPATIFPQFDHMHASHSTNKIIISWKPKINDEEYLFQKIHTPGMIEYKLNLLEGDQPGKVFNPQYYDSRLPKPDDDLISREYTDIDKMICFVINNQKTGQEKQGISDYDDLKSLLEELTRILSQLATQLKKHADAKMAVPPGVLDQDGNVINENIEMIEVDDENGMIPQYIEQKVKIQELQNEALNKVKSIARVAEVAGLLLDLNETGGAEKVGALRLRMLRTLAKVKRKQKPFTRVLTQMISTAYEWETGKKLSTRDITITYSNGLPEDYLEKVNAEATRISAGIQSLKDAIRNIDKLEGDALDEKVKEIEKMSQIDFNQMPQIEV